MTVYNVSKILLFDSYKMVVNFIASLPRFEKRGCLDEKRRRIFRFSCPNPARLARLFHRRFSSRFRTFPRFVVFNRVGICTTLSDTRSITSRCRGCENARTSVTNANEFRCSEVNLPTPVAIVRVITSRLDSRARTSTAPL